MEYCNDAWEIFAIDKDYYTLLTPVLLLELGHNPDNNNSEITDEERKSLLIMIPDMAHQLFHYWVEKVAQSKKESKAKVGRNDPCPCGSGKKYKKCCDGKVSATVH